jgi:aryl-alcohol dehydrogenase-like predicted oxidoreductase
MHRVLLKGTILTVSRFGLGTSGLFNVGSSRRRQRLIAAAYDHGITHFDTAPYYGFGVAERDLKAALAHHPDATIATKVGIYPPGEADQTAFAVLLRKAGGKLLSALSKPVVDWSVERARASLNGSLRRLGRERIDLYLLHEPEAHLLATDEWHTWLSSERDRVAAFGIACEAARLPPFLADDHPLSKVVQCSDSLGCREADVLRRAGRSLQITYGYISAAAREPDFDPEAVLAGALRRNREGCVLVSTSKEERFRAYADIAEKDANSGLEPARRSEIGSV